MSNRHPKTLLRYPGGKQKLTPFIEALLRENELIGCDYVEPYAGGAGVAMELLFKNYVRKVYLNDKCPQLYAFWSSLKKDPDYFAKRIFDAKLNMTEWSIQRTIVTNWMDYHEDDVGFAFFYLNRTNFSGVISGGVIGGKNQRGKYKLDARFPKERLLSLAKEYSRYVDCIELFNMDAIQFIREKIPTIQENAFLYCDPPYYRKGQKLYLNAYAHADHAEVAKVLQNEVITPWVVSYDKEQEIIDLYRENKCYLFDLLYSAWLKINAQELFVLGNTVKLPQCNALLVEKMNLAPISKTYSL